MKILKYLPTTVFAVSTITPTFGSAAVIYSTVNTSYLQNFNSLANTGTSNAWTNNSTIPNWYLFDQAAPPNPIATYRAGNGSVTNGAFYSFGTNGSTERALGGIGSSSVSGYFVVEINNSTGYTLDKFTLGFDGEQWRDGGNTSLAAQTMTLQYAYGSSYSAIPAASWISPGGVFNWSSPIATATAAAIDGNGVGLVAARGGTILSQSWVPGDTLWIRWAENNDTGNDHGLAIDNFSFTAAPEPVCLATLSLGCLALLRRQKHK